MDNLAISRKDINIEYTKEVLGLSYHFIKRLTEKEAGPANRRRDGLLNLVSERAKYSCEQNKIYYGELSRGCVLCGKGQWSCIYINGLCTANCFFCTQDRSIKRERPPMAERQIIFKNPDNYVTYLEKFGFKGVSFSGGEAMIVYEKVLEYIEKIRQKFGKGIYIWIYTNGDLIDKNKLIGLRSAGLDELRFNISPRDYDLKPVELATKFIKAISVEIPAIPEDLPSIKKCILKMKKIGVNYFNLHQLMTTNFNYTNFIKRNYTFLHYPNFPIFESEITALKIMKYMLDQNIEFPINYCTSAYKERIQDAGRRKRFAAVIREEFEEETDAGYIRRISIKARPTSIEKIIKVLQKNKCRAGLWLVNPTKTDLAIHSSLFRYINLENCKLALTYFDHEIRSRVIPSDMSYKEVKLNPNKKIYIKFKSVVKQKELTPNLTAILQKLFTKNNHSKSVFRHFFKMDSFKTQKNAPILENEEKILEGLKTYEYPESGFPEIY